MRADFVAPSLPSPSPLPKAADTRTRVRPVLLNFFANFAFFAAKSLNQNPSAQPPLRGSEPPAKVPDSGWITIMCAPPKLSGLPPTT